MTFIPTISAGTTGTYQKVAGKGFKTATLGSMAGALTAWTRPLPSGVSDGMADLLIVIVFDIALSSNQEWDLTAVVDAVGDTVLIVDVVEIQLITDPTNTNKVVFGTASANSFQGPLSAASTNSVNPDDVWLQTCQGTGWLVDGTHKLLRLANSGAGTPVKGTLLLSARSA